MTYEETIKKLQDNHIYPLRVEKNLRTGKIMSIEVSCSPLLKDSRIEHLRKLLGDGFSYQWVGNEGNEYVLIKKNIKK